MCVLNKDVCMLVCLYTDIKINREAFIKMRFRTFISVSLRTKDEKVTFHVCYIECSISFAPCYMLFASLSSVIYLSSISLLNVDSYLCFCFNLFVYICSTVFLQLNCLCRQILTCILKELYLQ